MSELMLFADSGTIEEINEARLCIQANDEEIRTVLRRIKESAIEWHDIAQNNRHRLLWLDDANATEKIGRNWSDMLSHFCDIEVTEDTVYRSIRWAALEALLGGDGAPIRLTYREARDVAKLIKQYTIELVKEAYDKAEHERTSPTAHFTLSKELGTNIRKFIELKLHVLPTGDPRKEMIQRGREKESTPGKKSEPPKTQNAVSGVADGTESASAAKEVQTGLFDGTSPSEGNSEPKAETATRTEPEVFTVPSESCPGSCVNCKELLAQLTVIKDAVRTFLVSLEGANMERLNMTKARIEALNALRRLIGE